MDRGLCGLQSSRNPRERKENHVDKERQRKRKREAELFDMLEKAATNENREERDRDKVGDKLEAPLLGKKRKTRQRASWKK